MDLLTWSWLVFFANFSLKSQRHFSWTWLFQILLFVFSIIFILHGKLGLTGSYSQPWLCSLSKFSSLQWDRQLDGPNISHVPSLFLHLFPFSIFLTGFFFCINFWDIFIWWAFRALFILCVCYLFQFSHLPYNLGK